MAQKKGGNISPASLANLVPPVAKGEVRNPHGRKGKDGTGGITLKGEFRDFIKRVSRDERDAVWIGLMTKAMQGDTQAIKLWVELNGEQVNEQLVLSESGAKIVINIPKAEE